MHYTEKRVWLCIYFLRSRDRIAAREMEKCCISLRPGFYLRLRNIYNVKHCFLGPEFYSMPHCRDTSRNIFRLQAMLMEFMRHGNKLEEHRYLYILR